MLRSRPAECITMYPAQHACFTTHLDAPCSPETHWTGQNGGQQVRERGHPTTCQLFSATEGTYVIRPGVAGARIPHQRPLPHS